jgi:hypothetical protein
MGENEETGESEWKTWRRRSIIRIRMKRRKRRERRKLNKKSSIYWTNQTHTTVNIQISHISPRHVPRGTLKTWLVYSELVFDSASHAP